MKIGASLYGWLVAAVVLIVAGLGLSPAFAHGAHHHAPAVVQAATAGAPAADVREAGQASVSKDVVSALVEMLPVGDPDRQPCQAPCCAGNAGSCCCGGLVAGEARGEILTMDALRRLRPGHDQGRPSRAAEAPPEPPRTSA